MALHRWLCVREDGEIANDALVLALAYPGALFFCSAYSESLFCALLAIVLLCVKRKRDWLGCCARRFKRC